MMVTANNVYREYRIALPDGRRLYLAYNTYTGPFFFYDKHLHRPVKNWINDQLILKSLFWFLKRGCKA